MFGIFICLLIIFLHAYYSGVTGGAYQTLVDINSKNEAHIELALLLGILTPIFILTVLWSFLDWKSTWKARDHIRFEQYYFEPERTPKKRNDTILMRCSGCQEMFGITGVEHEMRIECPSCHKSGTVKLPPSRREASEPGRELLDDHIEPDGDTSDSPRVRIIKTIRDDY